MGELTWDGIATLFAAGLAAVVVLVGYFVQQAISRANSRADTYSRAMQAIEEYLEGPYVIRRRDGSAAARQSITRHLSDVQSRIRYFESALTQDAPSAVSEAYVDLVAIARAEVGQQMSAAWRAKPTRRDRDVPLVAASPQPRTDSAKRKVVSLMAPGANVRARGGAGVTVGLGVVPIVGLLALSASAPTWAALTAALSASITLGITLSFAAYYWPHRGPRSVTVGLTIASLVMTLIYWNHYVISSMSSSAS